MPCLVGWRAAGAGLLLSLLAGLASASEPKQVLLLYDERTDLPGLAILDAGLTQSLRSEAPGPVEIYREALDLSRFGSDRHVPRLRDHLRAKYAGKRIDVVVAVMSPALDFLLDAGEAVFPGAPIVFCGIDRRELDQRALPSHVTGVILKREFLPTLRLVLQLHPDTTSVVFVGGTTRFDSRLADQARGEFREYDRRVALSYLTDLPMPELLTRLGSLPPRTVVLYSTLFRDGTGTPFIPHEAAERVASAATAPVYAFVDQFMGRGIVGGHLYSMDTHGRQAAHLARQILAGRDPSTLPPIEGSAGAYQFDWRQMQRWNIDERHLPAGALIHFREIPVWRRYRGTIAAAAVFTVLQSALILGLLFQRQVRRRAEATLRDNEAILRTSHEQVRDLAGRLITAQEGERARIARELHDDMGQQLAGLSIAISGLKRQTNRAGDDDISDALSMLQRRTIDLCDGIRQISHDLHPSLLQHLGLVDSIRTHCREFSTQHMVSVLVDAESELGELEPAITLCLYRAVQEALHNVAKHARASHAIVRLRRRGDNVDLSVADDGVGFDVERARRSGGGLGLLSIDERVRMAHGTMRIVSVPGLGSELRVRLAIKHAGPGSPEDTAPPRPDHGGT